MAIAGGLMSRGLITRGLVMHYQQCLALLVFASYPHGVPTVFISKLHYLSVLFIAVLKSSVVVLNKLCSCPEKISLAALKGCPEQAV